MNKIVVQVRGYDPYDYNVFDTSVRGVSDEKLERYVEEAIFNAKGCIGSSDYWTMTVYVLDPETHQIDVRYEHKQPLQVRIEVNLPAKRKSITINKKEVSMTQILMDGFVHLDEDEDEEEPASSLPYNPPSWSQIMSGQPTLGAV